MNILFGALLSVLAFAAAVYALRSIRRMLAAGTGYVLFDFRRLLGEVKPNLRDDSAGAFWITIAVNSLFATFALAFSLITLLVVVAEVINLLTP